jgi:hypothetical protein
MVLMIVAACLPPKNQNDPANPQASASANYQAYPPAPGSYPPGQYPQQQPYPAPQPTYAQPYPAGTAPPAAAPTPPPAASGQMAVPNQIALTCQNDVPCGLHHCNMAYGKCAFPCQGAVDCIGTNQCVAGFCVPNLQAGAQPQPQQH